jgi:hypothetical protein
MCVNPDHLFLGTSAVNNADKVSKGRQSRGEENGGGGKLTWEQVRRIRAECRPPHSGMRQPGSRADLARRFGVSTTTLCQIVSGQIWRESGPGGSTGV